MHGMVISMRPSPVIYFKCSSSWAVKSTDVQTYALPVSNIVCASRIQLLIKSTI